jgi:DNA invertase Pin-like site-specific DNA recombinase
MQDPVASLRRQITSGTEWLPPGWYIAGYYWDVESGGLDIEQRGHGSYGQFTAQGIPRDGGLADLLAEAQSPQPKFAAVVVEDIERAARDFYNSVKLERQLSDQGIPLFATDEPPAITGISPTTILVRRVKQGVAEWFRLQLKEKTWKGLKEHAAQGWNVGRVPYGYLPERITHPNPSKAAQGLTKTRLALDPQRAPIVEQIYAWRTDDKLGINAITARLNADPAAYPPSDPEIGWSLGGVAAILRNPKYTGYQVIGRRRKGRPVPVEQWHWSPEPTHPAIVDRATWDTAQQVGAEHATSRDSDPGLYAQPPSRRTYALRSRVRCKLCQRRMCGVTRLHPANKSRTEYAYYVCPHNPANPRHAAAAPDHPRTVAAREDLVVDELRDGLSAYALAPGRAARLAELLPADAAAKQAKRAHQAAALTAKLRQLDKALDSLVYDLGNLSTDPADTAAHAMRARIHTHFADKHAERETTDAELKALGSDTSQATDTDLLDDLPELTTRLADLPAHIQAGLFAAFDIQILWNPPLKQATFFATITDTTPGIIAALLTRAAGDPASASAAYPDTSAATGTGPAANGDHATSTGTFSDLARLPMLRETRPDSPVSS